MLVSRQVAPASCPLSAETLILVRFGDAVMLMFDQAHEELSLTELLAC